MLHTYLCLYRNWVLVWKLLLSLQFQNQVSTIVGLLFLHLPCWLLGLVLIGVGLISIAQCKCITPLMYYSSFKINRRLNFKFLNIYSTKPMKAQISQETPVVCVSEWSPPVNSEKFTKREFAFLILLRILINLCACCLIAFLIHLAISQTG